MAESEKRSKAVWEITGALVPAGLFIGMGIGWLYGRLVEGLIIGLGAGLLAMVTLQLVLRR